MKIDLARLLRDAREAKDAKHGVGVKLPQSLIGYGKDGFEEFEKSTAAWLSYFNSVQPEVIVSLVEALGETIHALEYISDHEWAVGKPKWDADFVQAAKNALAKIRERGIG